MCTMDVQCCAGTDGKDAEKIESDTRRKRANLIEIARENETSSAE